MFNCYPWAITWVALYRGVMGKGLSAAKWSLDLLGQRITALRLKKSFSESRIYSDCAYDESQMKEADFGKREQKFHLEYDC